MQVSSQANANSGKSQHELLFDLCKNKGAFTYYACPAVFDKAELYCPEADLDKLHLVDVASCPDAFRDNKKHHIYFDLPAMDPTWCSEPVRGIWISARTFAGLLAERLEESPQAEAKRLLDYLSSLPQRRLERASEDVEPGSDSSSALEALTVLRIESPADA